MTAIGVIITVVLALLIVAVICFATMFVMAYCERHGVDIADYIMRYMDWVEGLVARLDKDEGESERHD